MLWHFIDLDSLCQFLQAYLQTFIQLLVVEGIKCKPISGNRANRLRVMSVVLSCGEWDTKCTEKTYNDQRWITHIPTYIKMVAL